MADNNITFAKIVANPNANAWSQAYNAGKLFAVISLESEKEEEKDFLNVLGKEILDTLEQEFFTLETKDLESIKQAVSVTSEKIPNSVKCSFVIATYIENVLYLYLLGGGKISLKRGEKLGTLLESVDSSAKELKNASGYLQNGDTIVLQTKQFEHIIPNHTLSEFINNTTPQDAAEHIAPLVHEKDEAGAAAIVIDYKSLEPAKEDELTEDVEVAEVKNEKEEEEKSPFYKPSVGSESRRSIKIPFPTNFSLGFNKDASSLNHPRKVILTIVVVIFVVLLISIVFAFKKQQDSKTMAIFQNVYPQASKKYEEGKSLLGLNEGLAQDSFSEAKKLVEENINKLPKNSSEEKQLQTLLSEINSQLGNAPKPNVVSAKTVDTSSSDLLSVEANNSGLYYSYDADKIYMLTSGAIYTFKHDGSGKDSIITNDNDWTSPAGIANYFGNIYVLDKKQNQILKFVATDSGFSKSNYFSESENLNFSKAVDLTIDSSVYILTSDGKIEKFNKGASESFTISGLDKDLNNPSRIFTNADNNYLYVLDSGNSRIVVLEKSGKYKAQYQAAQVKTAKGFDINEKDSKAYILSGGKVYEINL